MKWGSQPIGQTDWRVVQVEGRRDTLMRVYTWLLWGTGTWQVWLEQRERGEMQGNWVWHPGWARWCRTLQALTRGYEGACFLWNALGDYSWTYTNRNMLKYSFQWSLWVWGMLFFCVCFIVTRTPLCRYKGQLYDLDKCSDLLLALQVPQEGRGLGSM